MKNNKLQTNQKRALIVSPYLDHLGGGERYILQTASLLQQLNYQVYFAWDKAQPLVDLAHQLGIELNQPLLHPQLKQLYFQNRPLQTYRETRSYDLVFYLSDGSIPLLGGRQNILHFQVPFHQVNGRSLKNKFKLKTISHIVVNSHFTKTVIDQEYGVSSQVVYPPVPLIHPSTTSKQPLILSVGRFEPSLNIKRQDVLIQAFKQLSPAIPQWKLVLVGGLKPEAQTWFNQLRQQTQGFPIEFKPNLSYIELHQLYRQATIYWHAAGYQVDQTQHPELVEHFGITTVEAISAGCLPLVVPKGGQSEIVTDPTFHWQTLDELVEKTKNMIQQPHQYQSSFNLTRFSRDSFNKEIIKLIKK